MNVHLMNFMNKMLALLRQCQCNNVLDLRSQQFTIEEWNYIQSYILEKPFLQKVLIANSSASQYPIREEIINRIVT